MKAYGILVILAVVLLSAAVVAPSNIIVPGNTGVDVNAGDTHVSTGAGSVDVGDAHVGVNETGVDVTAARVHEPDTSVSGEPMLIATNPNVEHGSYNSTEHPGVHVPGVVVTPGEIRVNPAVVRAEMNKDRVNADLFKGQDIEISPGLVKAGDISSYTHNKKVSVTINGSDIEVTSGDTQVTIQDGQLTVVTSGVSIVNGTVKVGDIEIKAPHDAIKADLQAEAVNVTLDKEDGKPVYNVKTAHKGNLFWLFPVTVNGETSVDAQTGDTIKVQNPWWNVLVG